MRCPGFVRCFGRWMVLPNLLLLVVQSAGAQPPNPGPHNLGLAVPAPTAALAPTIITDSGPAPLPSSTLGPFLTANLSAIVAPLDASGFSQPEAIAKIKASYAAGLAAAPANRQAAYVAAVKVCDALEQAMTERQAALTALPGATVTHPSQVEGLHGEAASSGDAGQSQGELVTGSQKNAWAQRAEVLRQNITALYLHERELERQAK